MLMAEADNWGFFVLICAFCFLPPWLPVSSRGCLFMAVSLHDWQDMWILS